MSMCWGHHLKERVTNHEGTTCSINRTIHGMCRLGSVGAGGRHQGEAGGFQGMQFLDGKTMADLDKVTDKFRAYANKNDTGYSAWILTPEYATNPGSMSPGWAAWPDGVAFGVSMEKWRSLGTGIAAEFAQVDCSGMHVAATSLPINAPGRLPGWHIAVVRLRKLNQGKTLDEAYAAHLKFGQTMKAKGSLSNSWMFTPIAGRIQVTITTQRPLPLFDLGDTMEMFVNRGGAGERVKIIDPVASCQTPDVFNALSVRAAEEV